MSQIVTPHSHHVTVEQEPIW